MLTTVKKLALFAVVTTAAIFAADCETAVASDHEETKALSFGFLVNARNGALILDILDWLGVDPIDPRTGPMPQTREHILLARMARPSDGGPLELQIYRLNRWQARRMMIILLLLENHHDPNPAAVYFIRYVKHTKV